MLLGSPLVVLGLVAFAAIEWTIESVRAPRAGPSLPVYRIVKADRDRAVVWQTSTGPEGCADVMARRKREEKARIAELMSSGENSPLHREDEKPCAPFQLGEVENGAELEVLDDYGPITKVRILSGGLQGRVGYIQTERIAAEPRPAS